MPDNTYSGATLEAALISGTLVESALEVRGMVKASDQAKHVAFALGSCDTWVDLPVDMIESAERLGSEPCKDHVHLYFKVTLKAPKDDSAKCWHRCWPPFRARPAPVWPGQQWALP